MSASPPQEKLIDGPVKKVDPMAKTVDVGWFLGLFNTTLEVTEDTRIAVEGAKASLQDIREGDRVKAAYTAQDGKNVARSIEVTQAETQKGADGPAPGGTKAP
jgi:Cu/Ag efflux protein CusF